MARVCLCVVKSSDLHGLPVVSNKEERYEMFHNPSSFTKLGQKHLFNHCRDPSVYHLLDFRFLILSILHVRKKNVIDKRYAPCSLSLIV